MNCYSSPTFEPMVAANYPLQSQYDIDNKHHAMGYKQSERIRLEYGIPQQHNADQQHTGSFLARFRFQAA